MTILTATQGPAKPGQRWDNLESFGFGQLGSSVGDIYTAPSTASVSGAVTSVAILVDLWLCNTDTVDRTVTLYIIESGGSAADNRAIMKDATISAKQTLHFSGLQTVIPAGGKLRGLADSASKVTYNASGVVYR